MSRLDGPYGTDAVLACATGFEIGHTGIGVDFAWHQEPGRLGSGSEP